MFRPLDRSRRFGVPQLLLLGATHAAAAPAALLHSAVAQSADPAAAERTAAKLRDGRLLLLQAAEFDPLIERPTLPAALSWGDAPATQPLVDRDYFLVQFRGPITPLDRATLAGLGGEALDFVPNHAFIVRGDGAAQSALQAWPRVRALLPFEPAYRLAPELAARAAALDELPLGSAERAAAAAEPLDVMVQLFRGCDTGRATGELLVAGATLDEPEAGLQRRVLARVPLGRLLALARVRDVQWIQPLSVLTRRGAVPTAAAPLLAVPFSPLARLPNDTTTWVIQSDTSGSTPVWDNGVLGDGVVIGHIDGAIDLDACWFDDPAVSAPGPTHRKVVAHNGSYSNSDGHGTHTAGTAAGDQEPINGVRSGNGIGYRARIAHTNDSLVGSSNFKSKLEELHSQGATLFTNSWGDDFTTAYNAWCVDIDEMMWEHPETLICFAVSNGSQLKNPENAKNVLAVGATEQASSQGRICSAGSGPTADGRRKPEIFAPGCSIRSANDNQTCSTTSMSGTSMACPAITGAAALVKSYYEAGWYPGGAANAGDGFVPSGALLKATLLNSSRDMAGESGYPTNDEGWGRLLLDHALYFAGDARRLWVADIDAAGGFSGPNQSHVHYVNVYANTSELNLCLAFTDAAGALNSSAPVVNDLDLEVVTPTGTLYRGNVFSGGFSTTGGSADPLNNVERVRITAPPLGWYVVTIRSRTVTTATAQPYALVATGNLDPPAGGGFVTYGSGTPGSGAIVPTLALSGSSTIGEDVTLTIGDGLGGTTALAVMGFARDHTPYAGGELLVAAPWITFTLPLDGTLGLAGDGDVAVSDTIPADPALIGTVLDFQALLADPAAAKKFALTNGAELTIGS
ncbi:MAG: S8 family serine peptidase [Planctomycetes bacterium]|nr:S8 family serine peptidase [Planctomycetota bacterium]